MEKIKIYLASNFEQVFVLVVLVAIFVINYYIPYKLAFLNFYFLPIILAGYYLGLRRSVLGAGFCILLVCIYIVIYPDLFTMPVNRIDLYFHVFAWGGFLILAGAVVGKLSEKLSLELQQTSDLNEELKLHQSKLEAANLNLKNYTGDLEAMVKERTEELEKSKRSVETLKTKVEETLYSTMDSTVAKLMIEGRLRNEKRKISVLFADLNGFTSYSEDRPPEMVLRDLNQYLTDMEPVIFDYKGHIDKYLGDGVMCEFGAPLDYYTYRLQAVIAALKMQEKMEKDGNYPWKMRIGIASGSAILGLIGNKRKSYTTIGDVVNLAARLESICPPGSILIDDYTLEGVHQFVDVRLMKDFPLAKQINIEHEEKIKALLQRIHHDNDEIEKAGIYHEIGKLYLFQDEIYEALSYIEKALRIQPENVEIKVSFAEATMKRKEQKKVRLRGKKKRIGTHIVTGIKDILLDRERVPAPFYEKFKHVLDLIEVPEDLLLPVEVLDGCIGHSKLTALFSYAICNEMGLSEQEKIEVLNGAFAADIGKEIIPHHILNRRGALTENEMTEVKKHPLEGTRILKTKGYHSETMLNIVLHSHENFNGSGYPDGLQREEIPLGSRVVAIVDTYVALTSWRPYRERFDRKAAFDIIRQDVESGVFDPQIVDLFVSLMN